MLQHVPRDDDIGDPCNNFDGPAEPLVESIRPRLLSRFRDLSSADLAVSGIFLAASKPA